MTPKPSQPEPGSSAGVTLGPVFLSMVLSGPVSGINLLPDASRTSPFSSRTLCCPPVRPAPSRRVSVQSIRGKYAFVKTSSEEFARRKHEELALER